MSNNNDCDSNKFIASKISARVGTSPKPIIRVRVNSNSNSKASADHDLILAALARLTAKLTIFEGLFSEFLEQQKSEKIRRREARW